MSLLNRFERRKSSILARFHSILLYKPDWALRRDICWSGRKIHDFRLETSPNRILGIFRYSKPLGSSLGWSWMTNVPLRRSSEGFRTSLELCKWHRSSYPSRVDAWTEGDPASACTQKVCWHDRVISGPPVNMVRDDTVVRLIVEAVTTRLI